jgi:hypothetical protein
MNPSQCWKDFVDGVWEATRNQTWEVHGSRRGDKWLNRHNNCQKIPPPLQCVINAFSSKYKGVNKNIKNSKARAWGCCLATSHFAPFIKQTQCAF